ncbi:MAG TPA: alpha/beta hydrolase [Magnetospirillaceae bacterium]|jgi:dienelactone hydrolase
MHNHRSIRSVLILAVVSSISIDVGTQASAADKIGIVLMHGLQGSPLKVINGLASTLRDAGYLVETPEMCWSRARVFDRTLPDCLKDVDAAVAKLKQQGATAIVVGGESLGGDSSIAYGAMRDDVKGIIGLAPAGDPQLLLSGSKGKKAENAEEVSASIAKAQDLVAKGKGDENGFFVDINQGRTFSVSTSANIYLSFLGPDSLARMRTTVPKLKAPILWVAGTADPSQASGRSYAFDKAPANPLNRYVNVDADHLGTPDAARETVLAWLKELAAH